MLAWVWLPETAHRRQAAGGSPWRALADIARRPQLRLLLSINFIYWTAFTVYTTTFALFGARRFGFDAVRTGYLFAVFGVLGVVVQGALVGPIVRLLGERKTLTIGLLCAAVGWGGSALTYSFPLFLALLVPGAIGIGPATRR